MGPLNFDAPFFNPTASVPGPWSPVENRGYWHSSALRLVFGDPTVAPLNDPSLTVDGDLVPTTRALWGTPVFDLRQDLGASASAVYPTAIPILRGGAFGAGARLIVTASRVDAGNMYALATTNLRAYSLELLHTLDPQAVAASAPREDAIDAITDGTNFSVLDWSPPGNPIRFWQVFMIFDWFGAVGAEPQLVLQGSVT